MTSGRLQPGIRDSRVPADWSDQPAWALVRAAHPRLVEAAPGVRIARTSRPVPAPGVVAKRMRRSGAWPLSLNVEWPVPVSNNLGDSRKSARELRPWVPTTSRIGRNGLLTFK